MDECALLDLLECSVCLERLDASARVLPCQHTFCRRCLENIVSSRRELRCPECRVLVDCGVGELPANILLVRLLDGLKHRGTASPPNTTGTGTNTGTGTALLRDSPSATRSSPVQKGRSQYEERPLRDYFCCSLLYLLVTSEDLGLFMNLVFSTLSVDFLLRGLPAAWTSCFFLLDSYRRATQGVMMSERGCLTPDCYKQQ
ncbi:SH3 domain-containing RING finger protein 3, partial [Clarias magur]